jgi:hypothetical protein
MDSEPIPKPERFDVDHWVGKLFLLLIILIAVIFWGAVILGM